MANFKNNKMELLQAQKEEKIQNANNVKSNEEVIHRLESGTYDLYSVFVATQSYFTEAYSDLFSKEGRYDGSSEADKARGEKVRNLLIKYIEQSGYHVKGMTDEELTDRLFDELVNYSVLTKYIRDPEHNIEEINVNAWNDIEVRYSGGKVSKAEPFFNQSHAQDVIRRLVDRSGGLINAAMPMAEASLSTNVRITALRHPIVDDDVGVACSIRILRPQLADREFFIRNGTITEEEMKFLEIALKTGVSMIFVGSTGAGKTTLMNYLLTTIDDRKRIITIEHNARELSLIKRDENGNAINNVVHMQTRPSEKKEQNISQEDLVAKALRLDPNVICVGEMRDSEAYAAQEASLTGHTVVSSIHADGVEATHYRIAMLALKRYQVDISVALLQAAMAFPLIVYLSKLEDNSRKVMEISECVILEDKGESVRLYNKLFEYKIVSNKIINGKYVIEGEHVKSPYISDRMLKTMIRGGATPDDLAQAGIILDR